MNDENDRFSAAAVRGAAPASSRSRQALIEARKLHPALQR
jgi:hypothetical protein